MRKELGFEPQQVQGLTTELHCLQATQPRRARAVPWPQSSHPGTRPCHRLMHEVPETGIPDCPSSGEVNSLLQGSDIQKVSSVRTPEPYSWREQPTQQGTNRMAGAHG